MGMLCARKDGHNWFLFDALADHCGEQKVKYLAEMGKHTQLDKSLNRRVKLSGGCMQSKLCYLKDKETVIE